MQKYQDVVLNSNGQPVSGASIRVVTYSSNVLANIYSSDNGSSAANPITTNTLGEFSFYAANGRYSLIISGAGIATQTISDISLQVALTFEEYGAVGDGVTDDSNSFQTALTANPNGQFTLFNKTYLLNSNVLGLNSQTVIYDALTVITGTGGLFNVTYVKPKAKAFEFHFTGAPSTQSVVGIYSNATNSSTTAGYGQRFNYVTTGAATSGFNIGVGHICDFRVINGAQSLATWAVAASPSSTVTMWGSFCEEMNAINRSQDSGYAKRRGIVPRWTGGLQIVPGATDFVGGTGVNCYPTVYAFACTPSSANSYTGFPAKTYNGFLCEQDAIAPLGRGSLLSGDTTANPSQLPNYALEIDQRWKTGIYMVEGIFTSSEAIKFADDNKIVWGIGTNPPSMSGNSTSGDLTLTPGGTGVIKTGYNVTVASVAANFSATRTLAFKDGSGTTYYIPASTATW